MVIYDSIPSPVPKVGRNVMIKVTMVQEYQSRARWWAGHKGSVHQYALVGVGITFQATPNAAERAGEVQGVEDSRH